MEPIRNQLPVANLIIWHATYCNQHATAAPTTTLRAVVASRMASAISKAVSRASASMQIGAENGPIKGVPSVCCFSRIWSHHTPKPNNLNFTFSWSGGWIWWLSNPSSSSYFALTLLHKPHLISINEPHHSAYDCITSSKLYHACTEVCRWKQMLNFVAIKPIKQQSV